MGTIRTIERPDGLARVHVLVGDNGLFSFDEEIWTVQENVGEAGDILLLAPNI
jgi:hypothetical protein